MADIQPQLLENKKRKSYRKSLWIDMTPMVDLGFLLITFFIYTATMGEKTTVKLVMPKDGEPIDVPSSKAITVILGKDNKVYFYKGDLETAIQNHSFIITNYDEQTGLGSLIRKKQQELLNEKDKLVLLIKPTSNASYENIINTLDEVAINNVQRYAIGNATPEEMKEIFIIDK